MIPTQSSSQLGRPAHVLEVPQVKGLEPPVDHPPPHGGATLLDDDAGALVHGADATQEETAIRELRLEDRALQSRNRDEKAAEVTGLRSATKVSGTPFSVRCRPAVAVPRVTARPNPLPREIERPVDRREALGLEQDLGTAPLGHLVNMTEEPEPRNVRDGVHVLRQARPPRPCSRLHQPTARSSCWVPIAPFLCPLMISPVPSGFVR